MRVWIFDLDDTLVCTTRDMRSDPKRLSFLKEVEGAKDFLKLLEVRNERCVLVTAGEWALQMRKLERLKLSFTQMRIIPDDGSPSVKRSVFESLIRRNEGSEFVVVGDRLDRDIAVGKSLGFTTIRMCLASGKYSHLEPQGPEEVPDHTVADFFELIQLPFFGAPIPPASS